MKSTISLVLVKRCSEYFSSYWKLERLVALFSPLNRLMLRYKCIMSVVRLYILALAADISVTPTNFYKFILSEALCFPSLKGASSVFSTSR